MKTTETKTPYHLTPGASQNNAFTSWRQPRDRSLMSRRDLAAVKQSAFQTQVINTSRGYLGLNGKHDIRLTKPGQARGDLV